MDFNEFKNNIKKMESDLKNKSINPADVKIEYTKFDGYDCIWAMHEDNVITYFKW